MKHLEIFVAQFFQNLTENLFIFKVMSSSTFGQKRFSPRPPDKGSFPLDHENLCKTQMIAYMKCLNKNDSNSECRIQAKDYLQCRMENNLMAKEEWKSLGYKNIETEKTNEQTSSTLKATANSNQQQ